MSPERLNGEHYSYTSDVWSLGILVLTLMIGKLPFKDSALMFSFELIKAVSKGIEAWDLPDNLMTGRTLLQDFVSKCIAINPDERSTAEELLKHPWIVAHRVGQNGLRDMLHNALESEWKLEDSPQMRSAKRQAAERYSLQVAKHIVKEYGNASPRTRIRKIPRHTLKDLQNFVSMCGAPSSSANARIVREFILQSKARTIDAKTLSPNSRNRFLPKSRPFARKNSGGVKPFARKNSGGVKKFARKNSGGVKARTTFKPDSVMTMKRVAKKWKRKLRKGGEMEAPPGINF